MGKPSPLLTPPGDLVVLACSRTLISTGMPVGLAGSAVSATSHPFGVGLGRVQQREHERGIVRAPRVEGPSCTWFVSKLLQSVERMDGRGRWQGWGVGEGWCVTLCVHCLMDAVTV
jgi:hypothetical protein